MSRLVFRRECRGKLSCGTNCAIQKHDNSTAPHTNDGSGRMNDWYRYSRSALRSSTSSKATYNRAPIARDACSNSPMNSCAHWNRNNDIHPVQK